MAILLAVFTESPKTLYFGVFLPATPAGGASLNQGYAKAPDELTMRDKCRGVARAPDATFPGPTALELHHVRVTPSPAKGYDLSLTCGMVADEKQNRGKVHRFNRDCEVACDKRKRCKVVGCRLEKPGLTGNKRAGMNADFAR